MRLVNIFMDEDTGRIITRDDWNTGSPSQIDFVISSSSLVCVDTGVDEHMDFATDHRSVLGRSFHLSGFLVHRWVGRRDPHGVTLLLVSIGIGHQTDQTSVPNGVSWSQSTSSEKGSEQRQPSRLCCMTGNVLRLPRSVGHLTR